MSVAENLVQYHTFEGIFFVHFNGQNKSKTQFSVQGNVHTKNQIKIKVRNCQFGL